MVIMNSISANRAFSGSAAVRVRVIIVHGAVVNRTCLGQTRFVHREANRRDHDAGSDEGIKCPVAHNHTAQPTKGIIDPEKAQTRGATTPEPLSDALHSACHLFVWLLFGWPQSTKSKLVQRGFTCKGLGC